MATLKQKVSGVAVSRTVIANYDDSTVVHNAGTETVAGVKTFTESPQVPNIADASDASMKVANTKFVKDVVSAAITSAIDAIYPIGSYAFGVKPDVGTWEEVVLPGKYQHNILLKDNDSTFQTFQIVNSDSTVLNTREKIAKALYDNGHRAIASALGASGIRTNVATYIGAYSPDGSYIWTFKIAGPKWESTGWAEYRDTVVTLIDYPAYKRTA